MEEPRVDLFDRRDQPSGLREGKGSKSLWFLEKSKVRRGGGESRSLKRLEKKDEAQLGLGTGRGIQCGRGCPALGSLVRNGATATTPEPSPHAFDPLCSLRCRRLPTKADPTTPRKDLEMQQPFLP